MKGTNILFTIFVLSVVLLLGVYAQQERIENKFLLLSFHCRGINSDFTRPDGRLCKTPIDIEKNVFSFITRDGVKENYLIIGVANNSLNLADKDFLMGSYPTYVFLE